MANLTDYLSGPSGGKPIINTERQSVDVFGAIAESGGALLKSSPDKPDAADLQKATDNQAMSVFTTGVENILSGKTSEIPSEIRSHSDKIRKMKRAGLSPVQIDAEIQGLIKRVKSKYPESSNDYYKWLNDQGLDDFVFRDAKRVLELEEEQQKAVDTDFQSNAKLLSDIGYAVDRMSPGQTNSIAREIKISNYALAESKRIFEEMVARRTEDRNAAEADRAATRFGWEVDKNSEKELQDNYVKNIRVSTATNLNPVITGLNDLTAQLSAGEINETEYKETITGVLQRIESERAMLIGSITGITEENRTALDKQYDMYADFTKSLLSGDLDTNKRRVAQLDAWANNIRIEAIERVPGFMITEELLGPAGVDYMLRGIVNSDVFRDFSTNSAVGFTNWITGKGINQLGSGTDFVPDQFYNSLGSEDPVDTSKLREVLPGTYNGVVKAAAGTLPETRAQLFQLGTKEAATYFARSFSSVVPELQRLPQKASSSEAHVKAVLNTVPPKETLGAVVAYEAAGGSPEFARKMYVQLSKTYFLALNDMYKDYTSNSLGSTASPMKGGDPLSTSLRRSSGMGIGQTGGKDTNRITFNTDVGVFEGKNPKTKQMNALLDAAVKAEKGAGNIPKDLSEIGVRAFLVKGIEDGGLMDQSIMDYLDDKGWPVTSPGEVLTEAKEKEEQAAKATTGKKIEATAAKAQPAKAEKPIDALRAFSLSDIRVPELKVKITGGSQMLTDRLAADPQLNSVLVEIDRTEGGGNYTTLYDNAQDSSFSNIDVTAMTVDELIEFTKRDGDYWKYVDSVLNKDIKEDEKKKPVGTPLGRYQIVGGTLAELKKKLGLSGNELFDQDLQDAMFLKLYEDRINSGGNLADEWHGLRGTEYDRKN